MSLENPRRNAKVERDNKEEADMAERNAYVSGLYRPEEDTRNATKRDMPTVEEIRRGRKRTQMRRRYNSEATPETRRNTARMLGEKDDQ